jgi:hypothetical protein
MLTELAQCGELYHTPAGTAYADIPVNDHQETWPVRSKTFSDLVAAVPLRSEREAASPAAIRSALELLAARALNSFLNLPSRNDFVLIVAWLLAALRPSGPYPLLAISGEQGSAKTVLSKLLKALVDPSAAPVRALSREQRELMIAANNGFLLPSIISPVYLIWLSDAPCRLATGGSFGRTAALYRRCD